MVSRTSFALLAVTLIAAPLSAQIRPRVDTGRRTTDGSVIRSDGTIVRKDGTIIRPDGSVIRTSDGSVSRSSRIPPGQLPPRGMCRVWIDGVAPGQQPPIEDCASARVRAARTANARVIYGDDQSFPGRGKNRKSSNTACVYPDRVQVNGRTVDVCRDANGNIIWDRNGRTKSRRGDDDDDRFENRSGKEERKAQKKAKKHWSKAAKKQEKRNRDRDDRDN